MRRVLSLVALLLAVEAAALSASQQNFEQLAIRAEQARTANSLREAIRLYQEAVRLRPAWGEGWWWLGSLYYEQDRFAEAQAALSRFVTAASDRAPAYAFLGLCEYETRDYDRALAHFAQWAAKGSPGTDDLIDVASFHWALLLTRKERFVEALYLLAAKAEKRGRSPALVEAMGLASLRLAALPEEYPAERRELVWLAGEAAVYSTLHDFDRSQEYARKLLLHYAQEPNVHYFRGTMLAFEKRSAMEAAEEFEQELKISPRHVPALLALASIRLDEARAAEAAKLAERATALDPGNAAARHMLGRSWLEAGRASDAARELEAARQLAPDSAPVRFHLARAYHALGRKKEAQQELADFAILKKKEAVLASPQDKLPRKQPETPR